MAVKPLKPKMPAIDCKPTLSISVDMAKAFAAAFAADMDEITVRISGYDQKLDPTNYQCIAKFSDRTKPWCCTVNKDPAIAFIQTLADAAKSENPTMRTRTEKALGRQSTTGDKPTGLLRHPIKRRVIGLAAKGGKKA